MTTSSGPQDNKNDIFWKQLDDSIQRLGELSVSDKVLASEKREILNAWDEVRQWRSQGVPAEFREDLVSIFLFEVLKKESDEGFSLSEDDVSIEKRLQHDLNESDYQTILDRSILSLGLQQLSYWSLIPWKDLHSWHTEGVPDSARDSIMNLQELVLTGLEQEFKMPVDAPEPIDKTASKTSIVPAKPSDSNRPQLVMYRDVYADFYQDILDQDVKAIYEAEEEIANSNLIIGQQIYRVRTILSVYSQRKFLEWLKGICCKICNISWRKAYDLMYAYESRRFVERNQPELLSVFDFQIQRFQCEARRFKDSLIPVLETAKEENKRFTLEEVKELFPSEKSKPPEDKHVSELRMSLKKLLTESLISDLSRYIQAHPSESFQSILDSALRTWLIQQKT